MLIFQPNVSVLLFVMLLGAGTSSFSGKLRLRSGGVSDCNHPIKNQRLLVNSHASIAKLSCDFSHGNR